MKYIYQIMKKVKKGKFSIRKTFRFFYNIVDLSNTYFASLPLEILQIIFKKKLELEAEIKKKSRKLNYKVYKEKKRRISLHYAIFRRELLKVAQDRILKKIYCSHYCERNKSVIYSKFWWEFSEYHRKAAIDHYFQGKYYYF